MASTTTEDALPYPEGSDATDVPGDIQALAEAVDGAYMLPDDGRRLTATTAAVTYYLDGTSGDNGNDGLSAGGAKLTWSAIAALLPRRIRHDVTVRIIGDYSTSSITLDGFTVSGGAALTSAAAAGRGGRPAPPQSV